MDAKVTLSFDQEVVEEAKAYAERQGLSLSRLTEILLRRVIQTKPYSLEDYPISDWVSMVSDGEAEYITTKKSSKASKKEFRERKK